MTSSSQLQYILSMSVKCKAEIFHLFNTFECRRRKKNYHINWTDHVLTCVCGSVCGYQCVNMYNWNWRLNLIYSRNTNHQNSSTHFARECDVYYVMCVSANDLILRFAFACKWKSTLILAILTHNAQRAHYLAHLLFCRIYRKNRKDL